MCGYIKLNRDFLTKLIDKPKAKLVYLTLVENAQIQEQEYNNKITLQRGDVYLSQKQISEKTSLTRQEVREALTLLLDLGIMSKNNQKTTKPTTKPTTTKQPRFKRNRKRKRKNPPHPLKRKR